MIRHLSGAVGAGLIALTGLTLAPAGSVRGAVPAVSTTAVAASAVAYVGDDFWEDRFNAMRKIWGTPYVPLGYYWDQARGLPNRPAPVAPGVYSDRPIYGPIYGGYGRGYNYSRGYNFGPGYGYGPGFGYGAGGYPSYPGYGYPGAYPMPFGGYRYGW